MRLLVITLSLVLLSGNPPQLSAKQPARTRHAMVVAEEPLASEIGSAVLKSGGNAVDAAVAVGFALAVTFPYAGNLGGGGFMLVRLADGSTTFLDFRERAPAAATRDMYLDPAGNVTRESVDGWRASGVPGTVRGLQLAHKKFGRKTWPELLAPSIALAKNGFTVPYSLATSLKDASAKLGNFPESKRVFLNDGAGFEMGSHFAQPDLARTLKRVSKNPNDFYEGETARLIAAGMAANGGLITLDDLKGYKVAERKPLTGKYREFEVITAPPPSSGGIGILQMLGMLENSGYEKSGAGSAACIHYVAEVMRRFFADRSEYFGDPDFFHVPVEALLNPAYIARQKSTIDPHRATPSSEIGPGKLAGYESTETTHFSIIDKDGNAVAMTYTLNAGYGSKVTVPGTGILLNNEMDDFSAKPGVPNMYGLIQGEGNAIQPQKRPLSAMTPTILVRDAKPFLVVGGPGGPKIISSVLQVILNIVDFGMNVQDAVDAPRFHHQWQPDIITLERGFSPDTIKILESLGHKVELSNSVARIEAIVVDNGLLQGGADGRGYGKAEGY
ncbi:MAG: gamma-glutamyltransferase [Bryobacteraceae bacterium]